jgi:predicted GNAT family acetyltransferase
MKVKIIHSADKVYEFLKDKIRYDYIYQFSGLEEYMNMGLCNYSKITAENHNEVVRLEYKHLDIIKELIAESYPEAWLDDELVKLSENFGIFANGKLISFAGIHAYSKEQQVAAVAHVTTHPDYRNKGYGEKVVGALTSSLKGKIKYIGLNVKTGNLSAVKCYKKLGFKEFGRFAACEIEVAIK